MFLTTLASLAFYLFSSFRLINSIKHEHSCKIIYLCMCLCLSVISHCDTSWSYSLVFFFFFFFFFFLGGGGQNCACHVNAFDCQMND